MPPLARSQDPEDQLSRSSTPLLLYSLNGHGNLSWEGAIASAACFCPQQGTGAYSVFTVVRWSSHLTDKPRHPDFLCSLTFDVMSQLDRDTTTALATIRERRNSFTLTNRVPSDVLCLIPTHLPTQRTQLRAASVCRHWRKTFLQYGTLWSRLFLQNGEAYAKAFLERAKRSPLDVFIDRRVSVETMSLLSPHVQQIRSLDFSGDYWEDVKKFSEINRGSLPLLRTLRLRSHPSYGREALTTVIPPSTPFFSNAFNLGEFICHSEENFQFSNQLVFPNLTRFELWVKGVVGSGALDLLDFLKGSPILRTIDIDVSDNVRLEDVPREMVVVLPNVETFLFRFHGGDAYDLAAHISCPRAKSASIAYKSFDIEMFPGRKIFPTSSLLNTIIHQYSRSPVEEATIEIKRDFSSLIFTSSDTTTISLIFDLISYSQWDQREDASPEETAWEAFSQGFGTILAHPRLSHIRRLHIRSATTLSDVNLMVPAAIEAERLFTSVGPLDELTISGCDLRPYLAGVVNPGGPWKQIAFPPIKKLTVLRPSMGEEEGEEDGEGGEEVEVERCMDAIVEFAKSQHVKGMPFESVTVCTKRLPMTVAERLRPLVGVVDCSEPEEPPRRRRRPIFQF